MNARFLIALFALCSTASFALDLDSMMTPDEKKTTGYSSLSKKHKKALNLWLTQHVIPVQKVSKTSNLSLDVNIQNGQELILNDGSKWFVDPEDRKVSSLWLTPIPLKLSDSSSLEYPKLLINLNDEKEHVKVKPVS